MGLSDRDYERWNDDPGGGGARRAFRRVFVGGDNFFAWALPLFTAFGVRVRVHLFYVLYVIVELVTSLSRDVMGPKEVALGMGALFLMVLLHEFGHIFACRKVGGEADEILMWPLGGLASVAPPNRWTAHFWTTAGGPLVNVALVPVFAAAVLAVGGGWSNLVFNPFNASTGLIGLDGDYAYWKYFLWWLYFTNWVLLAFNLLLPMYPMDGARLAQALMWRSMGYRRSMEIAVNVGFVTAVIVGLFAIVSDGAQMLLGIAIFGGFTCWNEKRRLQFEGGEWGTEGYAWRGRAAPVEEPAAPREEDRKFREAAKRQEAEAREQAEVDRILAKIAQSGMASLTRRERATLEAATERKRRG